MDPGQMAAKAGIQSLAMKKEGRLVSLRYPS